MGKWVIRNVFAPIFALIFRGNEATLRITT